MSITEVRKSAASTQSAFRLGLPEFALLIVYFALSLMNMQFYWRHGRFWAEEGRDFYIAMLNDGWSGIFNYLHHGHLELLTNAIVYCSTKVPLLYAPLVTTYLSLFLAALPIILLLCYRRYLQFHPVAILAFILIMVGIPKNNEVQSNSINLHFHLTFLVLVIMLLQPASEKSKNLLRGMLLLAGLSGIPPNFLIVVFFSKAYVSKDREAVIHAAILTMTVCVQLSLLYFNMNAVEQRGVAINPITMLFATFTQTVLAPVFMYQKAEAAARILRSWPDLSAAALALAGLIVAFYSVVYWRVRSAIPAHGFYLGLSFLIIVVASISMGIGDRKLMINGGLGSGRYFFVANAILFLALAMAVSKKRDPIFAIWLLLAAIGSSVGGYLFVNEGPNWHQAYQFSTEKRIRKFAIWPDGWYMRLPRPNRETH